MADSNTRAIEPTVLTAVWRYRWLVLFIAIAFAGLGYIYASQTSQWSATATLAVQDPRSSNLFDQANTISPDRYVEAQVAILNSRAVARRAVDIAAEQDPPIVVSTEDVVSGLSVSSSQSSDIVTVSYTAETQREAIGVVNSVATAYQEIGRVTADQSFTNAVTELDRSIADLQAELETVEGEILARQKQVLDDLESNPERVAEVALLDSLVAELLAIEPPSTSASPERLAQFASQLQILNLRISTVSANLDQERATILALSNQRHQPNARINR